MKLIGADVLGSAAFKPVKNDMTGNIKVNRLELHLKVHYS
jgi:hypothetical protein